MFSSLKNAIRKFAWKILGTSSRPQLQTDRGIDTSKPRFQMLDNAITIVNHNTRLSRKEQEIGEKESLLGDYLEFGCFEGSSFIHAYKRAAPKMPWMRFWAFDSFEGLPKPTDIDKSGEFWEGQFACDQDTFLNNLSKAGIDHNRVMCVPGWFNESLTQELKHKNNLTIASLVYIDCDFYNSTIPVLNFITDLVETGSVIMFDDWFCFKGDPQKGVQRACSEWLDANPEISLQEWHLFGAYGKSFMVVRSPL